MKLIKSIKKKIAAVALIGTTIGTIVASGNTAEAAETYPLDKEWMQIVAIETNDHRTPNQSVFVVNPNINSYTLQTAMKSFSVECGAREFLKKNDRIYTNDIKNWLQQFIYNDWLPTINKIRQIGYITVGPHDYQITTPVNHEYHFNGKHFTGHGINMKNTKIGAKYNDTSPMSVYNMPPKEWFEYIYQTDIIKKYQEKYHRIVYSDIKPLSESDRKDVEEKGYELIRFENVDREKAVEAYLELVDFSHYSNPKKAKDVYRYIYSVDKYKDCGYIMGSPSYWTHK